MCNRQIVFDGYAEFYVSNIYGNNNLKNCIHSYILQNSDIIWIY